MERKPGDEQADQHSQWDELAQGPQPESLSDGQDISEIQAVRRIVRNFFEKRREQAPEQVRAEAHAINDIEQGFIKQQARDRERGRETSEAEFNEWEQDYARTWKRLQARLSEGDIGSDQEAELESEMFFTKDERILHETVEAQAGKYYRQRSRALREAIEASDSKTKDTDLRMLANFYMSVATHLEYKYMTPEEIRYDYGTGVEGFMEYDHSRTQAHNSVIRHLNALNALAEQYGTTPFTPRNFWTSDSSNQTRAISRRMRYDRDVVEEYYSIAFGQKVQQEERVFLRKTRGY